MVFIYALCEPRTRKVRYIGVTKNLSRRLKEHLNRRRLGRTHLCNWLRSLKLKPNMLVLNSSTQETWQEDEARYIRSARALGMPLVNSTDGGDGVTMTPETRAKISRSMSGARNHNFGRKLPAITCAKMSASRMGKTLPDEVKIKIRAATVGKVRTPEACARIGAAKAGARHPFFGLRGEASPNFGRKHSLETRQKMSKSQRNRFK